jgi:hypothetical protein
MYIPAPIHDFFGYRGRNRQLHAMVGVIEAHVLEFPDQWIWTQYRPSNSPVSRGHRWSGLYNDDKKIIVEEDSDYYYAGLHIGGKKGLPYEEIKVGSLWRDRLRLLCKWHEERREQIRLKAEQQALSDKMLLIVGRFRQSGMIHG